MERFDQKDNDARIEVYQISWPTTAAAMCVITIMELVMIVLTVVDKGMFGAYYTTYRLYFVALLVLVFIYMGVNVYLQGDFPQRCQILDFLNPLFAGLFFLWAILMTLYGAAKFAVVDSTPFMIASLSVPLMFYMPPAAFGVITVTADSILISGILRLELEQTPGMNVVPNLVVFCVFQMFLGITLLRLKQKLTERILHTEEQKKEIEQISKSQNTFFANMSHEIRTPINAILGLNELILREEISDEVAEDAENMQASGKLLLHLINDILDMSKLESGQMRLTPVAYRMKDMLSEVVSMIGIRAGEKNLEFSVSVAPDLPSSLEGDEVRIKQILINVLNNAVKYTKQGTITLDVDQGVEDENGIQIIYSVSDTGAGIKKEDLPYLFTAFKRANEEENRHIEGTGLGLSIVKQLVDLMGGKITVNSVYTQGSTFVIELPQRVVDKSPIGQVSVETGMGQLRKTYKKKFEAPEAKLLIVDDDAANLLVAKKLLRSTGAWIDTAGSGAEALEKTLEQEYHVIFMDHLMPEMDGIECARRIRKQKGGLSREAKIVALTANAGEKNQKMYEQKGFDGYLTKPVSGKGMEKEMRRLLPSKLVRMLGEAGDIVKDTVRWASSVRKKRQVAITTESVSDLPEELIERYGIAILPYKIYTKTGVFRDGVEIETEGLLGYMEDAENRLAAKAPDVAEHERFFAREISGANYVVHIVVSSKIENSGYPQAVEAAASFGNVFVVDAENISGGQGLMVLEACRMAEAGSSPVEICERLEGMKNRIGTSFLVDNLDYLSKAGLVSAGFARITKSIMLRPVLVTKNGKLRAGRLLFGPKEQAWEEYIRIEKHRMRNADFSYLFLVYAGLSKRELDVIKSWLEKETGFEQIYMQQASAGIAANCGPGTFGLWYLKKG